MQIWIVDYELDNILFPADIGRLTKKEKTIYVFVFAIIPITFILSFVCGLSI